MVSLRRPRGIRGHQSAGVVLGDHTDLLCCFAQCARGRVGDEREKLRLLEK